MNEPSLRAPARRNRVLFVAVCGVAPLLVACGSTGKSAETPTSSTTSAQPDTSRSTTSSPTSTAPGQQWSTDQQAVIDAYLSARQAYSTSLEQPDPNNPQLPATHVDPMLTEARNTNAQWQGFGQAGKFPDNSVARSVPLAVEVTGDSATIETCGVDDSIVYEPATGKVLNDDTVTVHSSSTMTRVDGIWKLATRTEIERWKGVAGCALDFP
jgi:hypothetical protein